ncbi:MAG: polyprenyl synthetase family protein [Marinovum sp.]|nr:polyprenyl synthetase family protein [Marinovum sp.]
MSFRAALKTCAAEVDAHLIAQIRTHDPIPVVEAMAYAVAGGKGLRGYLVMESARIHGVDPNRALWSAAAIEAIHAYSLVHDDMPCMDDDDLRRGHPTVHIKWNETTAVLTGDALQSLGFELVTDPRCHENAQVRAELALTLARASGARGMVLGQALDIAAESAASQLTLEEITALQAGKTGALISWSAQAGAIMGQAETAPLSAYADALGLAFQIADDILDVEGDAEVAGKRLQKDADAGKATFVSLLGLEPARARAAELVDEAISALSVYGDSADELRAAARFVISRDT